MAFFGRFAMGCRLSIKNSFLHMYYYLTYIIITSKITHLQEVNIITMSLYGDVTMVMIVTSCKREGSRAPSPKLKHLVVVTS